MTRSGVEAVLGALNAARVRYLVAGGLAVVAHGLVRFTADIDVVLDPDSESLRRAIGALSALGYRPRAPVPFERFRPAQRRAWVRDKGLTVFSLHSPEHEADRGGSVRRAAFRLQSGYERALCAELAPGVEATFVGLADLLEMKREAGRPRDLEDVAGLESLRRR